MLMVYGEKMPLRVLEEIHYWKMQEKEHTVVIRELLPNLEPHFKKLMQEWENLCAQLENTALRWIEQLTHTNGEHPPEFDHQLDGFIRYSADSSQEFIHQLHQMSRQSQAIVNHTTAQVVMQHIISESEYFLGVIHAITASGDQYPWGSNRESNPPSVSNEATADTMSGTPYHAKESKPIPGQSARLAIHHRVKESSSRIEPILDPVTNDSHWSSPVVDKNPVPIGGHELPSLPYAYDALEPYIDEDTMRLHHDKHHKAYVDGLNQAEKMLDKARETGDFSLVKHWEREAAFNGAGHYLHTLFWHIMKPKGGGSATGAVAAQIDRDFGGFVPFRKHFSAAAEKVEGNGWAILVWSPRSHRLQILQAEKHQNLSQWDVIPLLVLDVWEHAYYLKHQNERGQYIDAWWNVIDWQHVNERFSNARRLKWLPY